MNIVIPLAGAGTRFTKAGVDTPKPLIEVMGRTLIEHSIRSFDVPGKFIFITRDYGSDTLNDRLSNILKTLRPECTEIRLKEMTSGAVETVLKARNLIDNDTPLVVYNCDQIIQWDANEIQQCLEGDAMVALYESRDPKNSFAQIEDGVVTRFAEKDPISNHALIGWHYWKRGDTFVESADKLMHEYRQNGRPECYISETFNYFYKDVLPFHVDRNVYIPLGTPEDLSKYVGKEREYASDKPKTIFCDIDGTIFKHQHAISGVYSNEEEILEGVIKKFDEWDSAGYKIILTTGRKESTRAVTVKQLENLQVVYDMLIMGVGTGNRILINDKLNENAPDRASSVNVITDAGFDKVSWEDYGL